MQLFLRSFNELSALHPIDCNFTIKNVKQLIEEKNDILSHEQRLVYGGRDLEDDYTLSDYGISNESTIDLYCRLMGGKIEPTLRALAEKVILAKQICRNCHASLPLKATNCRKRQCGHSNKLRPKKDSEKSRKDD